MNFSSMIKAAVLVLALACLSSTGLWADDFSFDDFSAEGDASSGVSVSSLQISGDLNPGSRVYLNDMADICDTDVSDINWNLNPRLTLDLDYSTERSEFKAVLNLDKDSITESPESLFDEAWARYYSDKVNLTLGWQTVVWGKGDKVHVLDVLNPLDFSDFYNIDYLDMKIPQMMLKADIPMGSMSLLEMVLLPAFTADQVPASGLWAPVASRTAAAVLENAVRKSAGTAYATAYTETYAAYFAATGDTESSSIAAGAAATAAMYELVENYSDVSAFTSSLNSLDMFQGAMHFTTSVRGFDLGALYYYGFNRTPTLVLSSTTPGVEEIQLNYDRLHILGVEAGTVFAGFNLRAEAAMYLTEDLDGDDPQVSNSSFQYIAGFDRGLPFSLLNLNLQAKGKVLLQSDDLSSGDTDYDTDGTYTSTYIIVRLGDSWNHEKIKPEVAVFYHIEDQDGMVKPKITAQMDDFLSFELSSTYYWGDDDTDFGQFSSNDYLELKTSFTF